MVKLSEPEKRYEKENVDPRKLATSVSVIKLCFIFCIKVKNCKYL